MWDLAALETCIRENAVRIAILCGDAASAQTRADLLFQCGIEAIVNMTDSNILLPYPCRVEYSSLSSSLSVLCAHLTLSRQDAVLPDRPTLYPGDEHEL